MIQNKVDPFTLEILKDAFISISDEMFVTMQRTSMSTIIYEVLDYATGLTDSSGRLITQGNGVTLFLGTLDFAVRRVLHKFANDIFPGDIFILNDPYTIGDDIGGGTHLSDVAVVMPIFYGNELMAFAANMGHWNEVGGMNTGSWTTVATEIYQEGLQLPCLKLYDAGKINTAIEDIVRVNVRTPEMSLGDMYSQVASVKTANQRFQEICEKYGPEMVLIGIENWLDYTEKLTRQDLKKIPNGVYTAHDYIDDDGFDSDPVYVCVKVTVHDGNLKCDYTGSHAQILGPFNTSRTGLIAGARVILKGLTDPSIPASDGSFRPLEVVCPDGTVFTAQRPAPLSCYWEAVAYASDLIWKALAPVLPNRLSAGHFQSVCGTIVSGIHPDTGELFILCEPQAGGWGAGINKDGENGLVCINDGETYVIPVEICEQRYGVLVDQFALSIVEGGAGEYRGGKGLIRDYRITGEEAFFTGTFTRFKFLPWGLNGGKGGSRNFTVFIKDGDVTDPIGKTAQYRLKKGEVARLITGTGGGYGNPYKRSIEKIQQDVKNEYLTIEQAERDYGVSLDPQTLELMGETDERKSIHVVEGINFEENV